VHICRGPCWHIQTRYDILVETMDESTKSSSIRPKRSALTGTWDTKHQQPFQSQKIRTLQLQLTKWMHKDWQSYFSDLPTSLPLSLSIPPIPEVKTDWRSTWSYFFDNFYSEWFLNLRRICKQCRREFFLIIYLLRKNLTFC